MTACLLVFYQQLRLYFDGKADFRPFLLEKPLWVFVGGKVNVVQEQGNREVSDVVDILLTLAEFTMSASNAVKQIERLLSGQPGVLDGLGKEIFQGSFRYLSKTPHSPVEIYADILKVVFNTPSPGSLHVEHLKGTDGEIGLRIGNNSHFGVINVGDASKLCDLCNSRPELTVEKQDFAGSLFHVINEEDRNINVLIGSKKFTEGWNSWRVSTMGLMNIGKSEGSEIIQLFGRGVRLKGHKFTLKRSRHIAGVNAPQHIELLETLNIFGVRADHMTVFRNELEEEGLPANEQRIEIVLPVLHDLGEKQLRVIRVKDSYNFKKDTNQQPTLGDPHDSPGTKLLYLDWYPKVQAQRSKDVRQEYDIAQKHEAIFESKHLAFLNFETIYFDLQRFKNEKGWHNLNLPKESLKPILEDSSWYRILIPQEELAISSFSRIRVWQEIATTLLRRYIDRFYNYKRKQAEMPNLEYRYLSADDPNLSWIDRDEGYRFLVDQSQVEIVEKLKDLKTCIERGELNQVALDRLHHAAGGNIQLLTFANHLYEPLVYLNSQYIEVKPVHLNEGERDFVIDLKSFHETNNPLFEGKELYLLRNQSKGKGIGFFIESGFYPDFLLWVLDGKKQFVSFVDPHGLHHSKGTGESKIMFHSTVKELERTLGDATVILNSFIISTTRFEEVSHWNGRMTKEQFEGNNVLFQTPERDKYIEKMLRKILESESVCVG